MYQFAILFLLYQDQFPDRAIVKQMQIVLDENILEGVTQITKLVHVDIEQDKYDSQVWLCHCFLYVTFSVGTVVRGPHIAW